MTTVDEAVAAAFRADWGRVLATLIGVVGDWDLAEEATQEAFAAAVPAWRRDGIPDRPRAWLTTTARNRAIDRLRRERVGATKLRELPVDRAHDLDVDLDVLDSGLADDRVRLLYTCCHPALSLEARVTLSLRTLCGLSTADVARIFGVPEATMAKRLVRTKRKIALAGIPYRVPPAHLLPERTNAVLHTIHLLYHDTYIAASGNHARQLAELVDELMPDEPEAAGLHALLLLLDARRPARIRDGALVPLEEQDHSRWDTAMIARGMAVLRRAVRRERVGPFQLQALIAGCHVQERIDWAQVVALYDRLLARVPSDTVRLNRAIAIAMRDGPDLGLLDGIDHPLVPAARADFLRRLGRRAEAVPHYREALASTTNPAEQAYLRRRLAEASG
ncbi:MAG TPA: sigma-70 family RNA polymerase sigma factor [Actinoplanes sp.]|nr:sigma-70 family RNA polymerase sigma factor [Actinoplanes sp.]